FLWVLPLALYLLSFVLCFEASGWYRRWLFLPLLAAGFAGVCVTLTRSNPSIWTLIPLYCATLFAACMVCHGELARSKPHPQLLRRARRARFRRGAGRDAGALARHHRSRQAVPRSRPAQLAYELLRTEIGHRARSARRARARPLEGGRGGPGRGDSGGLRQVGRRLPLLRHQFRRGRARPLGIHFS